jgi:hypothetical protein
MYNKKIEKKTVILFKLLEAEECIAYDPDKMEVELNIVQNYCF